KVNQGGVKLTVFELLTAKFAGDRSYFEREGTAFRLRRDWERIREMLDEHPVLEGFDNDDFLQAVTLSSSLHGPTANTARKEDVRKRRPYSDLRGSPTIVEGLMWGAKCLDGEHVHTASDLPYPKQIVPLAGLRVALGQKSNAYGVRARIRQWFWSGIFGV